MSKGRFQFELFEDPCGDTPVVFVRLSRTDAPDRFVRQKKLGRFVPEKATARQKQRIRLAKIKLVNDEIELLSRRITELNEFLHRVYRSPG